MKILGLIFCLTLMGCGKQNVRSVNPITKEEQDKLVSEFMGQRTKRCHEFKKDLPKDWIQGTVLVPEVPHDKRSKKIKVFYYGKLLPHVTPAVFFNGGPGSSSFNSYHYLKEKNVSLIFIDQRGTGCSDFYPLGKDDETLERLRHYGSSGIVADAEAVRKKININKPWIAFGQSYGGQIVHRYIVNAPEGLQAGISHGNAINEDGYTRIKNRVASHFRVIKNYLNKYPEDGERIRILARDLHINECYRDRTTQSRVCGYELLTEIPGFLAFTDDWESLHQWLESMVPQDQIDWGENGLSEWVSRFVFNQSSPYLAQNWSARVINYVDRNVVPMNKYYCEKIKQDLMGEGLDISNDPLHECAYALQYPEEQTEYLNPVRHLKRDILTLKVFKDALLLQPQIQLYLFSGENDQTVPKENFIDEVNHLTGMVNFYYKNFPETGHDGFKTEPEVWEILNEESLLKRGRYTTFPQSN